MKGFGDCEFSLLLKLGGRRSSLEFCVFLRVGVAGQLTL